MDPSDIHIMLQSILNDNSSMLGVWAIIDKNTLNSQSNPTLNKNSIDTNGDFIPYWYKHKNSIELEALNDYNIPGVGDWNLISRNTNTETITNPFYYTINKRDVLMTTISIPLTVNGENIGAIGADISLDSFKNIINKITLYETGYGIIVSNNGQFVAHPNFNLIGDNITNYVTSNNNILQNIKYGRNFSYTQNSIITNRESIYTHTPIYIGRSKTPWSFVTVISKEEILKEPNTLIFKIILLTILGIFLIGLAIFLITYNFTNNSVKTLDSNQKK